MNMKDFNYWKKPLIGLIRENKALTDYIGMFGAKGVEEDDETTRIFKTALQFMDCLHSYIDELKDKNKNLLGEYSKIRSTLYELHVSIEERRGLFLFNFL